MKLSLIIPTYNRAAMLEPTIQSVLAQTRPPDEIIVVDDGSTDETREVVERFGDRIQYHRQRNAGLAASRIKGLALSSGEVLCFLDSDDLLLPSALALLESALNAVPEAAVAYCRSQTIDMEGKVVEVLWWKEDHEGDVWEQLIEGNFIRSSGCALVRRSHLEKADAWDRNLFGNEDWDLWVRLAESAPFVRVDAALFQYRVHGANMSGDAFRMHCQTFRLLRKQFARNRHRPERLAYLRAAQMRARETVAGECFERARTAQRRGEERLAMLHLSRAAKLQPRYLLNREFLTRSLGTTRRWWKPKREPDWRGAL